MKNLYYIKATINGATRRYIIRAASERGAISAISRMTHNAFRAGGDFDCGAEGMRFSSQSSPDTAAVFEYQPNVNGGYEDYARDDRTAQELQDCDAILRGF